MRARRCGKSFSGGEGAPPDLHGAVEAAGGHPHFAGRPERQQRHARGRVWQRLLLEAVPATRSATRRPGHGGLARSLAPGLPHTQRAVCRRRNHTAAVARGRPQQARGRAGWQAASKGKGGDLGTCCCQRRGSHRNARLAGDPQGARRRRRRAADPRSASVRQGDRVSRGWTIVARCGNMHRGRSVGRARLCSTSTSQPTSSKPLQLVTK